ncbi:hypothetical protein V6457_004229 [Vibrio vulnificus]|nr:hypothetical protein [Vibrio vulnificus]EJS4046570.1 hypothetical protein [Vibrio vulnificus]HDY8128062.1 hypothetical protein [Vibrio vulnificus]HDZ3276795.1 hypothetical protein [Vibrio vulnificus]
MTTGEWLAVIFGSNGVTLAAAVFVSNLMIKNREDAAKEADRLRDATIENIETRSKNLERDVTGLQTQVFDLRKNVTSLKENLRASDITISKLRTDVGRLKQVVLRQKSLMQRFGSTINMQDKQLESLEETMLSIAKELMKSSTSKHALFAIHSELRSAKDAIQRVQRTVRSLQQEVSRSSQELEY